MATDEVKYTKEDLEFQLAELRREYLSCRVEDATRKGKRDRASVVRRSIARLLTQLAQRAAPAS